MASAQEVPNSRRVLVVDDERSVREVLAEGLEMLGYETVLAASADEALETVQRDGDVQLVLSDIDMPGASGLDLLRQIKAFDADIDVIMVTGVVDTDTAINSIRDGASDYVTKPFNLREVGIVVERTLEKRQLIVENRAYQQHLEDKVHDRTRELFEKKVEIEKLYSDLQESYENTLQALVTALDFRDNETQGHSWRVVEYSVLVAERMGVGEPELTWIRRGAILHDVGKIGIPDAVLRKPGKLTDKEWGEMKKHPEMGYRMLHHIPFLGPALDIVLSHQERWDGTGYPQRLRGEAIPLGARIFAVVDTFDAMTSDRPYRPALTIEDAANEIRRCSGEQFDPRVADAFLSIATDRWREIRERVHRQVTDLEEQVKRVLG
jgi:response regulator RpfG family c-di-GMP phosphodiesterase